ncbi:hypothetical protein ACC735_39835, partial [Rhizobium ruizarguesonis]
LFDPILVPFFGIPRVPDELPLYQTRRDIITTTNAGIGWSHTFCYENVLNTALLYSAKERYRLPVERQFVGRLRSRAG